MVNQADFHNYNRKKNNDNGINKDSSDRSTNNYNNRNKHKARLASDCAAPGDATRHPRACARL